VLLIGDNKLYLGPDSGAVRQRGKPTNVDKLCDVQWQTVQIPPEYLALNWPVTHVKATFLTACATRDSPCPFSSLSPAFALAVLFLFRCCRPVSLPPLSSCFSSAAVVLVGWFNFVRSF
jgi:hypothetical protein